MCLQKINFGVSKNIEKNTSIKITINFALHNYRFLRAMWRDKQRVNMINFSGIVYT